MNNTTLQEEEICFKVDIFPLFVFGFVVNTLALIAVLKAKPRESTPNGAKQIHILICCLAGSDTTSLGLQCLMPLASFLNCGWWGGKITCSLFGFVNAILILWSAWIVALLSFQRFLVTVFPFQHQSTFTTKKIKSALIYLFFIVCLFVSPPFFWCWRICLLRNWPVLQPKFNTNWSARHNISWYSRHPGFSLRGVSPRF